MFDNREYMKQLRKLLVDRFSSSELKTLCFETGIDYDDLGGESKEEKVISIIKYFERRNDLPALVSACRFLRSDIDWDRVSDINSGLSSESNELAIVDRGTIEKLSELKGDLSLNQIVADYVSTYPLLGLDGIKSGIDVSNFYTASIGRLRRANKPKSISELEIIDFKGDYFVDLSVVVRINDRFKLKARFISPTSAQWRDILKLRCLVRETSFFEESVYLSSPFKVRKILCPKCGNSGENCYICLGEQWYSVTTDCSVYYLKKYSILSSCLDGIIIPSNAVLTKSAFKPRIIFTSETYDSLMRDFQIPIHQVNRMEKIEMKDRYSKARNDVEKIIKENIIRSYTTTMLFGFETMRRNLLTEMCNVSLDGFKITVGMTQIYRITYKREIDYTSGIINKNKHTKDVYGEIWFSGDYSISQVHQSEG